MVEDFKERHRRGKVEVEAVCVFAKFCSKFGGNYNRFSCDNSSPLSIIDQMVNVLDKARAENRFIPWSYVFCDYSVTGLNPARQGYSSYKAIIGEEDHLIETTYIDDFTRASRDELEWWKLAHLSKRLAWKASPMHTVCRDNTRSRSWNSRIPVSDRTGGRARGTAKATPTSSRIRI